MGNKSSGGLQEVTERIEARCGKIPISGRYHRYPKVMEDDYDLKSTALGSGYNGVVRMATPKSLAGEAVPSSEKFAVKAFKLHSVASDKKAQLEAEVEIFLVMDHPHITRLYDVYETEDTLNLVMECMEGGELFDRVTELKRFSEKDAADAAWQMLLAINYLHSHGIVHRDLKLENFLYDKKGSNHLKLIDFGFSKIWDPNIKMHISCGTLSYVAPEVLDKSYTSQCDLWSLGVVVFILLAGYMPFSGGEAVQTKNISQGKYVMKPERWDNISKDAKDFVQSLLSVKPTERLTAQKALEHNWIVARHGANDKVDEGVAAALRDFGHQSKFRRCCMEMMAWSLSNEERAKVRAEFIKMDANKHGTITLQELKTVLTNNFKIDDSEVQIVFDALDSNSDHEIHYSDFLAAMCNSRIAMHDHLLRQAFNKFDTDKSGYITKDNLKQVLGEGCSPSEIEQLLGEADLLHDGRISFPEFAAYLRGTDLENHAQAANQVIEAQLGGDEDDKPAPRSLARRHTAGKKDEKQGGTPDAGKQQTNQDQSAPTVTEAENQPAKKQPKCCVIA